MVAILPLALLWAAVRLVRTRGRLGSNMRGEHLLPAVAIAIGILNHAVLVHRHAQFFLPWLFGWRHGLPLIFPLAVATIYLIAATPTAVRFAVVALVAVTVLAGALRIARSAQTPPSASGAETAFAAWVEAQPTPPTMLTARAQTLGMLTRGRYHWIACGEPPEQTRRMLERLPIGFVVVHESDRPCRFLDGLGGVLAVERSFGSRGEERIWMLRPRARGAR